MVIYVMMIVVVGVPSIGFVTYIFPTITGLNYYATLENKWEELIIKNIPKWLLPKDPNPSTPVNEAIECFYEGLPKGVSIPWSSWINVIAVFFVFSLVIYFIYFCLAIILRKQWLENERLSFPLVQLPEEIIKDSDSSLIPPFFKSKIMWIGFLIPFLLHSYNILSFFIPTLEKIQLRNIYLDFLFTEAPWNAMRFFAVSIYFSVIGFSFLLPVDVSFSYGFFIF